MKIWFSGIKVFNWKVEILFGLHESMFSKLSMASHGLLLIIKVEEKF